MSNPINSRSPLLVILAHAYRGGPMPPRLGKSSGSLLTPVVAFVANWDLLLYAAELPQQGSTQPLAGVGSEEGLCGGGALVHHSGELVVDEDVLLRGDVQDVGGDSGGQRRVVAEYPLRRGILCGASSG